MQIIHHKLKVQKTAHIYTCGIPSSDTKYLWIVTHGYGQLAGNIIRKFNEFDSKRHLIIAPEGLSSFYWKGVSEKAVSSWMTRKNRLDEIDDYALYLSDVLTKWKKEVPKDTKVILFGFSQGVATQIRWMKKKKPDFDRLIMWAGSLPEDLDYSQDLDYFNSRPIDWVAGDKDEFISPERMKWHRNMVAEKGIKIRENHFEGTHRIDRKVLMELAGKWGIL